jgi:hypothetical protein
MELVINIKLTPPPEEAHALRRILTDTRIRERTSSSQPRWQFGASPTSPTPTKPVPKARLAGSISTRPDERVVSFKANDVVSIWPLEGRLTIKSVMGKRQRNGLAHRKGEVDLMLIRGHWYLARVWRHRRSGRDQDDRGPWRRPWYR